MFLIIVARKIVEELRLFLLWTAHYVDVLKTAQSTGDRISKNDSFCSDFVLTVDFDAVMAITDAVMLENKPKMSSKVNSVVKNLPWAKKSGYLCHICLKIFLSERAFLRHVKSKPPEDLPSRTRNGESSILKYSLDVFLLNSFIKKVLQS